MQHVGGFSVIDTGELIVAAGAYVVQKNSQLVSTNQMPFQLYIWNQIFNAKRKLERYFQTND